MSYLDPTHPGEATREREIDWPEKFFVIVVSGLFKQIKSTLNSRTKIFNIVSHTYAEQFNIRSRYPVMMMMETLL